MNYQNKTKEELIAELEELKKKYNSLEVQYRLAISDKKKEDENRFVKEHNWLEYIIEATKTGIDIIDKDYNLHFVDSGWQRVYGNFQGIKCYDYFMGIDEPCENCAIPKALKTKSIIISEEFLKKENRYVEVHTIPFQNEEGEWLVGEFNIDITQRKINEKELIDAKEKAEESEERHRFLFENMIQGVVYHSTNGKIIYANNSAAKILGLSLDQLYGKTSLDPRWRSIHEDGSDYPGETHPALMTIKTKQPVINSKMGVFILEINQYRWININSIPKFSKENPDEIFQVVVTFEDITEIRNAKEKAEESDRLKTAFLQNMSHEIRTPLNSIIGFSERINSPKNTDEKRQFYTDIIVKSGFQLLSIVSDILTISSIDTGQEELNKENVCINSLISDIEAVFTQQLKGNTINLKVIKPLPNATAHILTDKTKLNQILTNLLFNAIKFTSDGEIEFGYNQKNNELEFYVKDNGIGIHKSKHMIIFDRFVQAEDNIHIDYGGTGLGLSICKGFVELLGGKIWLESELGEGATFYFTIPYKPYSKVSAVDAILTNQNEISYNENITVLVAEDQIFNYIYLEEHLKELNYKVIHAKNGKEAVEICRTNESIDIVLMDIRMPVMDGHKATMLIKEFRPDLKIIAQTAYATNVEIEIFGKAFDDYLTKPLTSEKLTSILNKHLNSDK